MADFVIREWILAPYPGDQAPPHVHHGSDEAFYVLDGKLEVLVGEERRILCDMAVGQLAAAIGILVTPATAFGNDLTD